METRPSTFTDGGWGSLGRGPITVTHTIQGGVLHLAGSSSSGLWTGSSHHLAGGQGGERTTQIGSGILNPAKLAA